MLNIPPFKYMERGWGGPLPIEDLFYGKVPELQYAQGLVGQKQAHVTLLFGIHPGPGYVRDVAEALDGWTPDPIKLERVTYFPSSIKGQDYNVIIASVVETTNLLEGRDRLTQLPHTDTYGAYRPHVTLAYINGKADKYEWIKNMSWVLDGREYPITEIDYGLDN
jgi:2'-5' RNA ligase